MNAGRPAPASTEAVAPVAAARALASRARDTADQAERDRRLDSALVSELVAAGMFRLCVPEAIGGVEADVATLVRSVEELARADAAAGWCVAIGATSGTLAAYLPTEAAREIFASPEIVAGGVFAPKGRAVVVDGGYQVSGRWPFASGVEHCDWLMGGCVVTDGDEVQRLESGAPDIRLLLFPAAEAEIVDTWHVSGLRATGSHDMTVADAYVPASRSASLISDSPVAPGPLYAFPVFALLALAISGVGLGIARGSIDDLVELAGAKTPTASSRRLSERAETQSTVAKAEAHLRSGRAFLLDEVAAAWQAATDLGEVSIERRTALRLAATHAMSASASAVDAMYHLGGGSSIYERSPLQRRFRDVHVATQHMLVGSATWELTGRLLLGLPTDVSQL